MIYDPCETCRSGFPVEMCRQICNAYKQAKERDVQRQLDETLFRRLARISK